MSKLDGVIGKVGYGPGGDRESAPGLTDEEAKQQIKDLFLELIGKSFGEEYYDNGETDDAVSSIQEKLLKEVKDL